MNDDKKMFTGDWKCSGCGAAITELPFEPKNTSNLNCRDCFMKNRDSRPAGGGGERKMFTGDWKCGKCQAPITELPFEPDPSRADQLTCRDCYSKR